MLAMSVWHCTVDNLAVQVTDADSELKFCQAITALLEQHREVVTMLAEGFTDCRRHIQVCYIRAFYDFKFLFTNFVHIWSTVCCLIVILHIFGNFVKMFVDTLSVIEGIRTGLKRYSIAQYILDGCGCWCDDDDDLLCLSASGSWNVWVIQWVYCLLLRMLTQQSLSLIRCSHHDLVWDFCVNITWSCTRRRSVIRYPNWHAVHVVYMLLVQFVNILFCDCDMYRRFWTCGGNWGI